MVQPSEVLNPLLSCLLFAATLFFTSACDNKGEPNIITQYANFDLLRRQEPDEAQRLNIPQPSPAGPVPAGTQP